jgi:hypothetical protein
MHQRRGTMKRIVRGLFATIFSFIIAAAAHQVPVFSQQSNEAVTYLEQLSRPSDSILADTWEYLRTSAHSKDPKLIEDKRAAMIKRVEEYISTAQKMAPFKGDDTLRTSVLKYLTLLHSVMRNDYAKIVDMKEIAEQSYDSMEAYLLAQEKANEKLNDSIKILTDAEKIFAGKNNITLNIIESELNKKVKKASEVMNYYNKIYLIFFKSLKQEAYLLEAKNSGDISKIEQNRKTLIKYSAEGLKKLSSHKSYSGDTTLINICKKALTFYKIEAEEKSAIAADFLIQKEEIEKLKKAFELTNASERTQEQVDQYNAKIKTFNETVNKMNSINGQLNNERNEIITEWNASYQEFISKHTPE